MDKPLILSGRYLQLTSAGIEARAPMTTVRFLRKRADEYEGLTDDLKLLEQNEAAARVSSQDFNGL